MIQFLIGMKISVKLQDMLQFDNQGAIFMMRNITSMSHTKHVDIMYKDVNEHVDNMVEKYYVVKPAENDKHSHKKHKCSIA